MLACGYRLVGVRQKHSCVSWSLDSVMELQRNGVSAGPFDSVIRLVG